MIPLSFRFEHAGVLRRASGFDSGWRSFGNTLVTQVRSGGYLIRTAQQRIELSAGMGFLIPPGLRHRVENPSSQTTTVCFVHFHCRVYELQGLFTVLQAPIVFDRAAARRVGACNAALVACQERGPTVSASAEVASQLSELVSLAAAAEPGVDAGWRRPDRDRLLPVLRHIQDHLADPLDRETLARVAGVSVPHLHVLFVQAFGAAPMEVVRRERMQHARQMLHWSPLPVAEVARRCGFDDPYYFSRAFRREEGQAPSRYRRSMRAQLG